MGKDYERIGARLHDWLLAQPVFVVATAPSEGGHVNASPKGMAGTFAVTTLPAADRDELERSIFGTDL